MRRYVLRMGELAEPEKHPLTCQLYREMQEWLKSS